MNVSNRAVISFLTDEKNVVSFSIPRARVTKTAPEASESMTRILESGALCDKKGRPANIHGAKIISTTRTQIV